MKTIYVSILIAASLLAQTPPSQGGKEPPRGPGNRISLMNPAALHAQAPATFKARFTTTKGDFVVEVHRDWAPNGADRFYNLVRAGYFVGDGFYRMVPNIFVQ